MLLAAILSIFSFGCDKTENRKSTPTSSAPISHPGTITGKVIFAGKIPKLEALATSAVPECDHPAALPKETIVVNANGTLRNVIVYLKGVEPRNDVPSSATVLDQVKCQYVPHVVAVRTGQPLKVKSSDSLLHNVHIADSQPPINIAFVGDIERDIVLQQPGFFKTRCDVHPWMTAWVGVFDNNYFAVTGDDGAFTIANIPPGSYTLQAWHERFGELSRPVTVVADATVVGEFRYK